MSDINIDDILEFNVSDPEYLQIVNGLRMPNGIIDWNSLLEYMSEENREYSKKHDLCEVCHSNLVDEKQMEEYCGSKMVIGVNVVCPNGCS